MPRQPEDSQEASTLPPPELNPLLNPVLAENMGLWAQVYFTSPPEKREQAVQELVRELEAAKSTQADTGIAASSSAAWASHAPLSVGPVSVAPAPSPQQDSVQIVPQEPSSETRPTLIRCATCGRANSSSQRFCGMCGAPLGEGVSNLHHGNFHHADPAHAEIHRPDPPHPGLPWDEPQPGYLQSAGPESADPAIGDQLENPFRSQPAPVEQVRETEFFPPRRDAYEPRLHTTSLNTNGLSLFQSVGDVDYPEDEDMDASRSPGSFRMYAAIALVVLVSALAYLAWRNAQRSVQPSDAKPPASFATSDEPVNPAAVPPSPAKTDAPIRHPSAENKAGASGDAAQAIRTSGERKEAIRRSDAGTRASLGTTATVETTRRPEPGSPAEASAGLGTGAEELAIAQGYLNGTNGQGRNSAEAAQWLWKAVAKDNANATFLLSEMYLRGDGVSKNCDQARVLLDAAALKGVKGAGERLRHLQAFGCQ